MYSLPYCSVVKVDNLISQWQQMGVEAPLDTSLEDALSEVLSSGLASQALSFPSWKRGRREPGL